MNGKLKATLKVLAAVAVITAITLFFLRYNTKAHSPEDTVAFEQEDLEMEVFYNRPYKKDREIFGKLVPYDEVWRTGANEATTFEVNKDILVDGSLLPAGKYTLWTIPMKDSWKVIFNNSMYPWGINLDKEAYRDPEQDKLMIEVPTRKSNENIEQFTIFFTNKNDLIVMVLSWDHTNIEVPMKPA